MIDGAVIVFLVLVVCICMVRPAYNKIVYCSVNASASTDALMPRVSWTIILQCGVDNDGTSPGVPTPHLWCCVRLCGASYVFQVGVHVCALTIEPNIAKGMPLRIHTTFIFFCVGFEVHKRH